MLFDLTHILYIVISALITIGLLFLCGFFVKEEKHKNIILKTAAVLTVIIHFSSLYVDYFKTGSANIEAPMLLPIYPCNVAMWLLVIVAFWKNKNSKIFSYVAEFTFYLGVVGGIVGILFNEIYSSTPNLLVWHTLKGLLSHSVMLFGCVYLLVGKFIKIRVKNTLSVFMGLVLLLVDGGIIIALYKLANLEPPNCMYLLENPFPKLSWFNTYLIGVIGLVVVFGITSVVELFALPSNERWYAKLKQLKNNKENK